MSRSYTTNAGSDAAVIASEVIRNGSSDGWCGSQEQCNHIAVVLRPFNIVYLNDMSGEWGPSQAARTKLDEPSRDRFKPENILGLVKVAMQPAEEMMGPEGVEYLKLMKSIADEATARYQDYAMSVARERMRP